MRLNILFLLLLLSQFASAELTIDPDKIQVEGYYHNYTFDIQSMNELNATSHSKSQKQVNDEWQAFLSTTIFHTNSESNELYNVSGISQTPLPIAGKVEPQLLRAILTVYRQDLEAAHEVGMKAYEPLKFTLQQKDRLYTCLAKMSMKYQSSECDNIRSETLLSETDFDKLRDIYSRIIRVSNLQFEHQYCELDTDPYVQKEQQRIADLLNEPKRRAWRAQGFFLNRTELSKTLLTPLRNIRAIGPSFYTCGGGGWINIGHIGSKIGYDD